MAATLVFNVTEEILVKFVGLDKGLFRGSKKDLEKLSNTVVTIRDVLLDAEEKSVKNDLIRVWLDELKEVMYDIGDLLDDLSAQSLQRRAMPGNAFDKEARLYFSSSNQLVYGLKLYRRIRDLRARLQVIEEDSSKFLLEVRRPEEDVVMPKDSEQAYPYAPETPVGRYDDKEAIVETLLSGNCVENVGTVPIVGIGGIGKTTLAQSVFCDDRVKELFDARWWVNVADKFDVKLILERIVIGFSVESLGDVGVESLDGILREKIKATKFLLVLDDVWNEDHQEWLVLVSRLNLGVKGSRILLTTRSAKVAKITNPIGVHKLEGLSEANSWLLFERWAFRQGGQVPSQTQREIGREIVSKCGGNPLAIKAMGSLLYTKRTDSEWSSFKDKELWMMDGGEGGIFSILQISFNNLPSHLKPCFSCCSLFPKNHKIRVAKLINLWIAHGLVKQLDPSTCLEAAGIEHFVELLLRSFFEEVEEDELGNMVSCKINNLMHDMTTKVAGTEFILSSEAGSSITIKSRHAAFFIQPTSQLNIPPSLFQARKLRTILLMNETRSHLGALQPGCRLEEQQIDLIASNLGLLRVLDLHSSGISRVPSSVCKLKLLTHLDLSENKLIKVLPDSITRLLSLQILKLDNCDRLKKLPKDTKVLANLIHLGVENCTSLTHMPSGIGRLTSLSTLSRFVLPIDCSISKYGGLGELQSLNDLRGTLKIYNLPHDKVAISKFQAADLRAKKDLRLLRLEWSEGDEDHNDYDGNDVGDDQMAVQALEPNVGLKRLELGGYRGSEFPSWLPSLTNLVGLALESCERCQCLPPLYQLNHLKSLVIEGLTALKYVHDGEIKAGNSEEFFPSLEKLLLSDCPELQGWWKAAPATSPKLELPCLSHLSHLSIMACPKLSSISMPAFPPLNSVKFSDSKMTKLQQILVPPEATSSGSSPKLELPCLSHLSHLSIMACPKLSSISMPAFPALNSVKFSDSKMTKLQQILVPPEATSSGSSLSSSLYSSSSVLAKLETLDIEAINDLVSFPEDLFQNLKSLKTLRVSKCRRLKTMFQAIRHLTSLTTLSIETCQELDLCDGYAGDDVTQWPGPKSLHSLSIDRIPNLVSLPEWIRHLTFLQRLELSGCRKLQCLPNWMTELRALQILIITWCPQLTDRCKSGVGEDWQHISHIPNIIVARKTIKGSLIY